MASYEQMADMIRLGAYRRGSDPVLDEAIKHYPALEKFLAQEKNERADIEEGYSVLASILEINDADDGAEFEDLELNNESPIHEATILNDS